MISNPCQRMKIDRVELTAAAVRAAISKSSMRGNRQVTYLRKRRHA